MPDHATCHLGTATGVPAPAGCCSHSSPRWPKPNARTPAKPPPTVVRSSPATAQERGVRRADGAARCRADRGPAAEVGAGVRGRRFTRTGEPFRRPGSRSLAAATRRSDGCARWRCGTWTSSISCRSSPKRRHLGWLTSEPASPLRPRCWCTSSTTAQGAGCHRWAGPRATPPSRGCAAVPAPLLA